MSSGSSENPAAKPRWLGCSPPAAGPAEPFRASEVWAGGHDPMNVYNREAKQIA
jgi:hypothetical protein